MPAAGYQLLAECAPFHFIGVGGCGMSPLAEILHACGLPVRGSDIACSATVDRLRALGIHVAGQHAPQNLEGARTIVTSSVLKCCLNHAAMTAYLSMSPSGAFPWTKSLS